MLERIKQLPGVLDAGTTHTNWKLGASVQAFIDIEKHAIKQDERVVANLRHVTPGYFSTLRVRVVEGRAIDTRDVFGAPDVAMVSRSFAARFWPGQSAIGRRIRRIRADSPWLTVVGVAEDVMDNGFGGGGRDGLCAVLAAKHSGSLGDGRRSNGRCA
jgi:hypothetical protein